MTTDGLTPARLLAEVHRLIESNARQSQGVWCRSAALLTRQALEAAVRTKLEGYASAIEEASFRAQLLCLQGVIADSDVARRAHYLWSALSAATHHWGYELAPGVAELREWVAGVQDVLDVIERRVEGRERDGD